MLAASLTSKSPSTVVTSSAMPRWALRYSLSSGFRCESTPKRSSRATNAGLVSGCLGTSASFSMRRRLRLSSNAEVSRGLNRSSRAPMPANVVSLTRGSAKPLVVEEGALAGWTALARRTASTEENRVPSSSVLPEALPPAAPAVSAAPVSAPGSPVPSPASVPGAKRVYGSHRETCRPEPSLATPPASAAKLTVWESSCWRWTRM